MVKEVSDMTKDKWGEVFQKNIYEFFNIVAFIREYNRRQKEAMEEWKRKLN